MRLTSAYSTPRLHDPLNLRQVVAQVLSRFAGELRRRSVLLEIDLDPVSAPCDAELLQTAMIALIQNAHQSLPHGGKIWVNLIDSPHQWELEFAHVPHELGNHHQLASESLIPETSMPQFDVAAGAQLGQGRRLSTIIPVTANRQLQLAEQAAAKLGGHLQIWDFANGQNHVLVVPVRQTLNH